MPDDQQAQPHLLELPTELRLWIYHLVIGSVPRIKLVVYEGTHRHGVHETKEALLLLSVCKQIRAEAHDSVWNEFKFTISISGSSVYIPLVDSRSRKLSLTQIAAILTSMRRVCLIICVLGSETAVTRLNPNMLPRMELVFDLLRRGAGLKYIETHFTPPKSKGPGFDNLNIRTIKQSCIEPIDELKRRGVQTARSGDTGLETNVREFWVLA